MHCLYGALGYFATIPEMRSAQVALHPHLLAQAHRIIMVAVHVLNSVTDYIVPTIVLMCARN